MDITMWKGGNSFAQTCWYLDIGGRVLSLLIRCLISSLCSRLVAFGLHNGRWLWVPPTIVIRRRVVRRCYSFGLEDGSLFKPIHWFLCSPYWPYFGSLAIAWPPNLLGLRCPYSLLAMTWSGLCGCATMNWIFPCHCWPSNWCSFIDVQLLFITVWWSLLTSRSLGICLLCGCRWNSGHNTSFCP